ncbi:MAG: sugar phosphate isomerase/epimerase family protein [Candidatus Omnitrophota bacterium]|jgi:sugar phosphate isomerase/epimerase
MGLVISTSWNAFRKDRGRDIIAEVKKIGFKEIELSFNLTGEIVEEIAQLVKAGEVSVSSLHNFCPIPDGLRREAALPDCYNMASLDEEKRKTAVDFTKRTIETAQRLNAKAVILHCGRVEIPDRTTELIDLYVRDLKDTPAFEVLRQEIIRERRNAATAFFEKSLKSLEELNQHAIFCNVQLGIETRYYYREIPTFEEIGIILNKFNKSNIFYWHDVGHAQVLENFGFVNHKAFLDLYGKRLLGIHLHDISGYHDHKAPGKGNFDFKTLLPYISKETIKVIEAHYPAAPGDLKKSKKLLEKLFNGKI